MIVISGALVLVALVLLVIGIVGPELGFVYASIGVSLVSLVFLVIGILQRRGEPLPATGAAPAPTATVDDPAESMTAVLPRAPRPAEPEPVAASAAEEMETGGTVLVVAGRPRYHVAGCRYLTGKEAEAVDVLDAREEGFSPCGVCKPDDALRALEAEEAGEEPVAEAPEPLALEEVEASTPTRVARSGGSRKLPAATREVPAAAARPAKRATAKATAPAVPAKTGAAAMPEDLPADAPATTDAAVEVEPVAPRTTRTPARTAAKAAKAPAKAPAKAATAVKATRAPSKAAALAVESTPAAAAAKKAGSVVVIPDRGRFHRPECRYVRGVDGAEVLSKTAATRQGYDACGVCKP